MPGLRLVARIGHHDGIIDGLALLWLGWTACLVFCYGQRWTLGHWCGGRVCGWAWHLRGGNTCCVYQIYASVDVGLGGCVTDGVGPGFATSSWLLLLDAFGGACQHVPLLHRPAIHRWRWCLFGFGCRIGYYDGIIDGLACCCDWVWTSCLVFAIVNDGLWVTVWWPCLWLGLALCVVVTLAVFTKFTPASMSDWVAV